LRKLSKFRKDIDREIRKKQEFQNEGYHFEFLFYFKRLLGQPLKRSCFIYFGGVNKMKKFVRVVLLVYIYNSF
ncbi:hypothetical protein ACODJC_10295, partial [Vagococcus fluvialis]|uniref:hypothetical protein n=1 Tax=Vagococcus fluvialis TaxID=2738 RepID=UPI003B5BE6B2